ncbi:MAG: hypothetical protein MZV49_03210 [Rhodopseudomonas palustris]|nr:hypothetical protein [Rhodopseudomonas palustris]
MSLASQIEFLRRLKTSRMAHGLGPQVPADSPLVETTSFGSNFRALRMWSYLPPSLPAKALSWWCWAWAANGGGLRVRRRLVDAGAALWLCAVDAGTAEGQ